jgi:hypothetical protein
VSDWFFMLGETITALERQHVRVYLAGLGILEQYPIDGVSDWRVAQQVITSREWDRRPWEAEQREVHRLKEKAQAACGQEKLREALSTAVSASEPAHGAAAVAAARLGCTDTGFIRAAAGAASEAAYLCELVRLAGEGEQHAFLAKHSLFAAGHWPLGVTSGRYYIF